MGITIIIILWSTIFSSCQEQKMEEKFDWSGTLSAPQEYPIEVYKGLLKANEYTQHFKNWGIINTGWGNQGGTVIVGSEKKSIPSSLEITWLSFAENKFYEGKFELPKEKITVLFKEGYIDPITNKKDTYKNIIIGLAPKGTVVVWLLSTGIQTEVARFKAHETQIDIESISSDDQYMFDKSYVASVLSDPMIIKPEIKEKLNTEGYPPATIYEVFEEKYNWKPKLELPNEQATFYAFEMCNGEKEFSGSAANFKTASRSIPYLFFINWKDNTGQKYTAWLALTKDANYWKKYKNGGISKLPLDFEKSEIRSVFEGKLDKKSPAEIIAKVNSDNTDVILTIKQNGTEILLKDIVKLIGKN